MKRPHDQLHRPAEAPYIQLADGHVAIDPYFRNVAVGDRFVPFSPLEFDVFYAVARRCGEIVTKSTLRAELWPQSERIAQGAISRPICRIREKLGPGLGDKREGVLRTGPKGGYYVVESLPAGLSF